MRYNTDQMNALNNGFNNATTREAAARYLAGLRPADLRAICKVRNLDQGGGEIECAKRILASRFDTGSTPRLAPAFTAPRQSASGRTAPKQRSAPTAGRYAFLDSIGRRCDAYGRTCFHNRATRRLLVQPLNDEGQPAGNRQTVLSCSRHVNWYRYSGKYTLISEETLPPVDQAEGKSPSTGRS